MFFSRYMKGVSFLSKGSRKGTEQTFAEYHPFVVSNKLYVNKIHQYKRAEDHVNNYIFPQIQR